MAVDVLGVTPQGEQRLAEASVPSWRRALRRAWRWGGRPAMIAAWGIAAAVIAGVIVTALSGYAQQLRGLLP